MTLYYENILRYQSFLYTSIPPPHFHYQTSKMKASRSLPFLLSAAGLTAAHTPSTPTESKASPYTIVVHLYAKNDVAAIANIAATLQEASQVYSNDKETLSWYVVCLRVGRYGVTKWWCCCC